MKCIILAAGYATRLYPLTKNFPKSLIEVKDKSIMEWLLDDLKDTNLIDEVIIVSNHKFYNLFMEWKNKINNKYNNMNIYILDDGSTDNENRLGAVKDIAFAISKCNMKSEMLESDGLLVLAGDNLLDFSFKGFIEFYLEKRKTCIMRYNEQDIEKLKRTGVVTREENGKVKKMSEQPQKPESNWAVPPFYIYNKKDLNIIEESVNNPFLNLDAPGNFIEEFCKNNIVYAYEMPGKRYDIGNYESLNNVQNEYNGIINN